MTKFFIYNTFKIKSYVPVDLRRKVAMPVVRAYGAVLGAALLLTSLLWLGADKAAERTLLLERIALRLV